LVFDNNFLYVPKIVLSNFVTVKHRSLYYVAKSVRKCGGWDASSHSTWLWHREAILHGLMRYSSARLNC